MSAKARCKVWRLCFTSLECRLTDCAFLVCTAPNAAALQTVKQKESEAAQCADESVRKELLRVKLEKEKADLAATIKQKEEEATKLKAEKEAALNELKKNQREVRFTHHLLSCAVSVLDRLLCVAFRSRRVHAKRKRRAPKLDARSKRRSNR